MASKSKGTILMLVHLSLLAYQVTKFPEHGQQVIG